MNGPVTLPSQEEPTSQADLTPRVDGGFSEQNAENVNQPLEVYETETGHPLIADELGEVNDYAFDVWENKDSLTQIDTFIKDELATKKYSLTVDNYKNCFKQFKERLGITEEMDTDSAKEKMLGFLTAFDKVRTSQEKKARREVLNTLYSLASSQDFDAHELELRLHEAYLKKNNLWS